MCFSHLGLVLTLLRYPMPTLQELSKFKHSLHTVKTKHDFLINLCWLDEFDEISLEDIQASTPFLTQSTKELLYWLFSREETIQLQNYTQAQAEDQVQNEEGDEAILEEGNDGEMVESQMVTENITVLDKEALLFFLSRHISEQPLSRFYKDYFDFGY